MKYPPPDRREMYGAQDVEEMKNVEEEDVAKEEEEEDVSKMWPRTLNRAQTFVAHPAVLSHRHTRANSLLRRSGQRPLNRGYQTHDVEPVHRRVAYERMQLSHDDLSGRAQYMSLPRIEEAKADWSGNQAGLKATSSVRSCDDGKSYGIEALREEALEMKKMGTTTTTQPGAPSSPRSEVSEDPFTSGKSTKMQAVLNTCNVLMGSGLLALPYAAKCTGGYVSACGLLALASAATLFTAKLLGRELHRHNARGFPDLAYYAFGTRGRYIVAVGLYFDIFLCLVLFLIMGGANISATLDAVRGHKLYETDDDGIFGLLAQFVATPDGCVWLLALMLVPATTYDDLTALSKFSAVGTISTVALVLVVTFMALFCRTGSEESLHDLKHGPNTALESGDSEEPFSQRALSVGLVLYCFAGHALFPSIYYSLKDPPQQWDSVIDVSYAVVFFSSAVVACAGYSLFGDHVSDQISVDISAIDRATGAICCTLIAVSAVSKFALELQPLALGIEELLGDDAAPRGKDEEPCGSIDPFYRSVALRGAILVLSLICAVTLPGFAIVDSLLGAIFATSISVLFPCSVSLVCNSSLSKPTRYLCWATIVVGTIFGALGTWGAWMQTAQQS